MSDCIDQDLHTVRGLERLGMLEPLPSQTPLDILGLSAETPTEFRASTEEQ